ncbi:hypothetical protein [Asanoa iriomotensis]|uniref:Uncharacterized protein n=1 Tax=Asanoa iriomotensis TaxID=234613 RepID=A0ABQ4CBQ4_9ACTN|nr:hypothetical protein [Asanoa iriomotensis]GIF60204.1 hypothetical protein Air01nite_62990 [Asanoa iriomotensis]
MPIRFGDRSTFAIEVGAHESPRLRVVDLWAADVRLTVHDNVAYVPSFCHLMRRTADDVNRGEIERSPYPGRSPEETYRLLGEGDAEFRERFWFMRWGETVDNLSPLAYLDGDLVLMFSFFRDTHPNPEQLGKVFVARIAPETFVKTIEDAVDLLTRESG